jgi:hypothetical protein
VRRQVAALGLAIMLPALAGANAIVVPGLARAAPQRPSDPGLVCGPSGVAEDFHKVVYKSPSDPQRPGMWFINFGNGQQYYDKHGAYAARGESSSILRETEGTTDFLRTQLVPDTSFEGKYVDVEASELRTGYSYGSPCADTEPTPGHPVQVSARMRCTCSADGSGTHVGSWGLWLWNGYPDVQAGTLHPITSMGINWIQAGGYFPPGLAASVLNETNPLYYQPVRLPAGLDLRDWHVYRFVWRADSDVEQVTFLVDNALVGATPIARPLTPMGKLSLTIWHDNQVPTDPTAFPATEIVNPTAAQNLDVDYVRVDR